MTGNDATKDERQRKNRENVDRIIRDLNRMFDLTEDRRNVVCGMEVLNDLLLLDRSFKDDNDDILQPLHLYFAILAKRVRLDLDTKVRNDEVEAYTEFFCEHKEELLEIFTFPRMQKVLSFLISDNLNIHDIEGYERIMKSYSGRISYYYRPMLYYVILNSNCGRLDLEKEIFSLYDRFDVNIVYYADRDTEPVLLKNLFALSKELGIEDRAEPVYRFIRGRHPYYMGRIDRNILQYYSTLALYEFQMDFVLRWIESIDEETVPRALTGAFKALMHKQKTTVEASFRRSGNPFEDLFRQCMFRNRDRKYSRVALHGEVISALDYYVQCSHETDIENGERLFNCNSHYYDLKGLERSVKFWAEFEKAVAFQNNIDERDGVFFFVNEWSLVNASLALPMLVAAEKHGFSYVPVCATMSRHMDYADPFLDDISGRITGSIDRRYVPTPFDVKDYEIDLKNKRIIVQGMNVYQPIYEFVARYQFSYFLTYDTDAWARRKVNNLIKTYDRMFTYIKEIEEWAEKNDKKVYFLSNAPHIHNAAAFRIYCEEKNEKGHLNYVCVSSGYDNYFKNIGDAKTETLTALNLTKNPYSRNSFLGTKEGFEHYYEENRDRIADIKSNAMQYLTVHRGVGKKQIDAAEKERILGLINECKGNGGRVVLLNGKVIFDLAVKYTRGCVHDDMSEWITHAVEFAKKHEDTLLLIKPHPHEKREDLTLTSNKVHTLRSIIRTDLADNTIFLDHDMFTNAELTPFVDIGLVWNGTSSLEFAAQGIPVLVGDVWGHYDYPIGFARPESLAEYESWLQDPGLIRETDDLSDRAVMFLDYMGSEDVRIENRYSKTTTLNFNQYDSTIDMNAVYDYFDHGDEKLDRLFESVR